MLCIGPLTNLALAIKLEPKLPSLLKKLVVMGGTTEGKGNQGCSSEFNFYTDPEAASIVFKSFEQEPATKPKLILFVWEACIKHKLTWEFFDNLIGRNKKGPTHAGFLLGEICGAMEKISRNATNPMHKLVEFSACDMFAAAVLADQTLITES